jgi:hypothetical protein
LFLLLAVPLCAQEFQPSFSFDDFSSAHDLHLAGSAALVESALRLTPARGERAGAAWFHVKQSVRNGFATTFRFQLTGQGGLGRGADGFAFVLQNSGPDAIAGRGSSGGFALGDGYGKRDAPGIPLSIAVFFDTFRNTEINDPSDNFLVLCTNGKIGEMQWPPSRLAHARKLKVKLKDRREHTARIVYRPPVLTVELDGDSVLTAAVDVGFVTDAGGESYVGFTASTGGGWENHDILSWTFSAGPKPDVSSDMSLVSSTISFQSVPCLPDRNLCTPDRAVVEQTAPGKWHIVLPAHLEWPASVPTPPGREAVVSNARGMACWDLAGSGADGCGGPATALATRVRDGRTWFSVKDPTGRYADNEGHFEFDVEVK